MRIAIDSVSSGRRKNQEVDLSPSSGGDDARRDPGDALLAGIGEP